MTSPTPPAEAQSGAQRQHAEVGLRQLTPLLVWGVVFADIGTSIYYVPGILFSQVGEAAPVFVLAATLGFVLLAAKYVEVCWRSPEGGGVVSVATAAFGEQWGALGGLLICLDYFMTSAISSTSGIHYLGSVFPYFEHHVVPFALITLALLTVVNIIGIRESAIVALSMAGLALLVDVVLVGVVLFNPIPGQWSLIADTFRSARGMTTRDLLIGFSGAWLAFSGLESISQISAAMKLPIQATAARGMKLVVASVLFTAPLLTAFSVALLPAATKLADSEHFMSELGAAHGGLPIKLAVVVSASALLLLAANTAIIGSYHVFVALSEHRYMPAAIGKRNRIFKTPHVAILVTTSLSALLVLFARGNMVILGNLYAFGLLGAFVLSSGGLDLIRWRAKDRGLRFWIGVATTLMVLVAWGTNLYAKVAATIFGTFMIAVGMGLALGTRHKWIADFLYRQGWISRRAQERVIASEQQLEAKPQVEVLSLSQAREVSELYPSKTLVAMRSLNPGLLAEAMSRERGRGGSTLYLLYVEERTGLFVRAKDFELEPEVIQGLLDGARSGERQGFTVIPVWTVSHNAVEGIIRAAEALGVDGVMVGVSQRSAVYHLLRGHVVNGLAKRMPAQIHLLLYT
jgi:amino acid transporter